VWIDDFVIRRHPVTLASYVTFLDALVAAGRADEADVWQPREPLTGVSSPTVLERDGARFTVANRRGWDGQVPVVSIPQAAALAYAAWEAENTGQPWRLPTSLEREKAARGTDGRRYPWGDAFDPAFTNATGSLQGASDLVPISRFPTDESPYGVRGLAGNVRDWCADAYQRLGAVALGGVSAPVAASGPFVSVRGGAHVSTPGLCRAASRFAAPPGARYMTLGFRLARDGPGRG
jgi:serine/threonine-protein kinase